MPSSRIRRTWIAAATAAVAALAFTGLAAPAQALDPAPDAPGTWIQEPRTAEEPPRRSAPQAGPLPAARPHPETSRCSPAR